jgi:pimeloyl-ACP methyl ester carboxylesterase
MSTELCRVTTADGLQLDGALSSPNGNVGGTLPVDAFLLIHGTGSNFYAGGVMERFAAKAVADGAVALRVNTRGHDAVATIPGMNGSTPGGAAYEAIADCVHDVRAWTELLLARGFGRVALVGHSMGGVKAIYSQSRDAHPSVSHVIAVSAPRFSHSHFMSDPKADDFRADYKRATDLVEADQGDELIRVQQPLPMLLTASGFLSKYGPHDNYNLVRHLSEVRVPALYMVGTRSIESSPAFAGVTNEITQLQRHHADLAMEVVEGANTIYAGCTELPYVIAADWLLNS